MAEDRRWAVRVTYADGDEAFLRHGAMIGEGPLVPFRTREAAAKRAEELRPGLNEDDVVSVVRIKT